MSERGDNRFGREKRISSREEISRVFEQGRRKADNLMTLYALPNERPISRCMVAMSKRHGNAVTRNRIKRLCREAFRLSQSQIPGGWDLAIVPRVGTRPTLVKLQRSLVTLAGLLISDAARSKPCAEEQP